MAQQQDLQQPSFSAFTMLLAVLSAVSGLLCAATFAGLGASLALDGTGRYRLVANLAWVGVIVAVLGAILMLWWAIAYWRSNGRDHSGRWVMFMQLLIVLLALGAVVYGDLRIVLTIPLVVGLLCNGALLLSVRNGP